MWQSCVYKEGYHNSSDFSRKEKLKDDTASEKE
jgi:hypothetical protein